MSAASRRGHKHTTSPHVIDAGNRFAARFATWFCCPLVSLGDAPTGMNARSFSRTVQKQAIDAQPPQAAQTACLLRLWRGCFLHRLAKALVHGFIKRWFAGLPAVLSKNSSSLWSSRVSYSAWVSGGSTVRCVRRTRS